MKRDELIIWSDGWQKVKVSKDCMRGHHKNVCLQHGGSIDFAYCKDCGLRSPDLPHNNLAWAVDMLNASVMDGTAFVDLEHLILMHFLNFTTGELSSSLVYRYDKTVPVSIEGMASNGS